MIEATEINSPAMIEPIDPPPTMIELIDPPPITMETIDINSPTITD
jgi:hypothetical protein